MDLAIEPARGNLMEVHCEDFRNGRTWTFTGVLWLDPADATDCLISAKATAANLHGEVETQLAIPKAIQSIEVSRLIDLDSSRMLQNPHVHAWLADALASKNFDRIEWERGVDSDDD